MQVSSSTSGGLAYPAAKTVLPSGSASSNAGTSASASAAGAASAMVDYNSFLKLMVAELQNQDPTAPSDPTQYMSQLASFSAVGQSVQTNQKLDTMLTTTALAQADAVIGHTVKSADGNTSGKVVSVAIGSGGIVTATLDSGKTLVLGNGVSIS